MSSAEARAEFAPPSSAEPPPESDSQPGGSYEIKVILAVLLVLLAAEGVARYVVPTSTHYQAHVNSIPAIASQLATEATRPPTRSILFLGNSLFWHGLDEELIAHHLELPARVGRIAPSGSAVLDWYYLLESHFLSKNAKPDVVVFGFVSHHIDDSERVKYRTLARYFLTPSIFPEFAATDLETFDQKATALLSMGSVLIGDQPDIRMFLDNAIPWSAEISTVNRLLYRQKFRQEGELGERSPSESFTRLERLISLLREYGIRGVFVCMPRVGPWDLEPGVRDLVEGAGMGLIDARNLANIGVDEFQSDGYHLNGRGKKGLSLFLADQLNRILRESEMEE